MFLSKSCVYAIRAVLYIAIHNPTTYAPLQAIARELRIPFHFLTKIARVLVRRNIIDSTRGLKGGVRLARAPEKITLLEITEAVDGPQVFSCCVLGLADCHDANPCPLHDQWAFNRDNLRAYFSRTNLANLVEKMRDSGLRLADT